MWIQKYHPGDQLKSPSSALWLTIPVIQQLQPLTVGINLHTFQFLSHSLQLSGAQITSKYQLEGYLCINLCYWNDTVYVIQDWWEPPIKPAPALPAPQQPLPTGLADVGHEGIQHANSRVALLRQRAMTSQWRAMCELRMCAKVYPTGPNLLSFW